MFELAEKTLGYIKGIWRVHVYPLNVRVTLTKGCGQNLKHTFEKFVCYTNCHSVDQSTEDIPLYEVVWTCGLKTLFYLK